MELIEFEGSLPALSESAFVAKGAILIGKVTVGDRASVWFNAVLRGDNEPITVGDASNVQDGCVLHTDPEYPCRVGEFVTVGHNVVLHGCTVEDGATIGMGATVLNGATVCAGALVAANALVLEGFEVPPGTLAAGVPAKVRRELNESDVARFRENAEGYVKRSRAYMRWEDKS
ncbi:MAG: gamma carbonic anhydrase family protein [Gemmatimonadetes bacterium]|jgi:carbonic anhydrase/acetyltransferase-like protein (isoleucine patch superfamily)|nr:gamma carbonic anhydrase family protein [Gemmatimonadota bacterium]